MREVEMNQNTQVVDQKTKTTKLNLILSQGELQTDNSL